MKYFNNIKEMVMLLFGKNKTMKATDITDMGELPTSYFDEDTRIHKVKVEINNQFLKRVQQRLDLEQQITETLMKTAIENAKRTYIIKYNVVGTSRSFNHLLIAGPTLRSDDMDYVIDDLIIQHKVPIHDIVIENVTEVKGHMKTEERYGKTDTRREEITAT